jgi:hypothetical protein
MSKEAKKPSSKGQAAPSGPIPAWAQPWAITASAMPAAMAAHFAVQGDPLLIAGMGAGSAVLTGLTSLTWRNRHEYTRTLATVFTGAVTGWFTLAASGNPLDPEMVKLWALGAPILSLCWNVRHFAFSPAHEADKAAKQKDPLFERVSALAGGRSRKIKEDGSRIEATVQLKPGEGTADEVVAARKHIASAVGLGVDDVTVTPVKGHGDRVHLAFQPSEEANAVRVWAGPSMPGRSVADGPLVYGGRADGTFMGVWMCGDDETSRPLGHYLITGAPNAGKTEALKVIIVDGRTRRDFCAVVGDPDKFEQSFGEIADTLSIAAKGPAQVKRLVANLPDAIRYRAELLGTLERSDGTTGYPQWEPECWTKHGIPIVLVDIEEAATVLSSVDEDFDTAVRTARSTGIVIVASMQSAHSQNIERKTRGLFANALTFGLMEDYDVKFALSSSTREAGADPTKWGADQPGKHYAEVIGTPRELWAVDGRAFKLSRAQKRAELEAGAGQAATLDPGTAAALGAGIDVRHPAPGPAEPGDDRPDPFAEPEEEDQVRDYLAVITEEDGSVDITQAIPAPSSTEPFRLRGKELGTEEARAILAERLDVLEQEGTMEISYDNLRDLPETVGRTRQWVYAELKRLTETGRLEAMDGKPPYRIRRQVINGTAVR